MACPYFIPAEVHEREFWPHRERLPLGDGFAGRCAARAADVCAAMTRLCACTAIWVMRNWVAQDWVQQDSTQRDATPAIR